MYSATVFSFFKNTNKVNAIGFLSGCQVLALFCGFYLQHLTDTPDFHYNGAKIHLKPIYLLLLGYIDLLALCLVFYYYKNLRPKGDSN